MVATGDGRILTDFDATAHCCRLACRVLMEKHHHLLSYAEEQAELLHTDKG